MTTTEDEVADWLERQLKQLVDRLDGLIRLRSSQRKALLGDTHSDNWQGTKRQNFESDYRKQQAAFTDLKQSALSLRASVARARAEAKKNHD